MERELRSSKIYLARNLHGLIKLDCYWFFGAVGGSLLKWQLTCNFPAVLGRQHAFAESHNNAANDVLSDGANPENMGMAVGNRHQVPPNISPDRLITLEFPNKVPCNVPHPHVKIVYTD